MQPRILTVIYGAATCFLQCCAFYKNAYKNTGCRLSAQERFDASLCLGNLKEAYSLTFVLAQLLTTLMLKPLLISSLRSPSFLVWQARWKQAGSGSKMGRESQRGQS